VKLPRDISGEELAKGLGRLGYHVTRQTGSHIRLTCALPSEHHLTIPSHHPLRVGTLAAILSGVAAHQKISKDEVIARIFERN
jgi:predicted RNA binding protein YcfA (HicA-like mRNA interferase family)